MFECVQVCRKIDTCAFVHYSAVGTGYSYYLKLHVKKRSELRRGRSQRGCWRLWTIIKTMCDADNSIKVDLDNNREAGRILA